MTKTQLIESCKKQLLNFEKVRYITLIFSTVPWIEQTSQECFFTEHDTVEMFIEKLLKKLKEIYPKFTKDITDISLSNKPIVSTNQPTYVLQKTFYISCKNGDKIFITWIKYKENWKACNIGIKL